MRIRTLVAVIFLAGVVIVAGTALYLMFSGPRMRVQPKVFFYQTRLPAVPAGIVPVSVTSREVPSAQAVSQWKNPLPDTQRSRRTGQVYYGYYCAFCHGRTGQGDGPVGQSYSPAPTDLTSPQVQALSDGELYRAILTGVGHDPVLPLVIDPNDRWYLVSYVRSLRAQNAR